MDESRRSSVTLPVEAHVVTIIDPEQFKSEQKKLDIFKTIIPSIMSHKRDSLPTDTKDSHYPAFIINRALSQHLDCLGLAQNVNERPWIPMRQHYVYLLNTVRKGQRPFIPWAKKPKQEEAVNVIATYHNISRRKAERLVNCVTAAQIDKMKSLIDLGG
jgi:hypothetical protein